jgi:putative sigma-54 modulation protein
MEFYITGRHVDLTDGIKDYANKRLKKIENYFDFKENGELHVIITVEKYRHIAEANLMSKWHKFSAKVETKDMYSSIDMLEDKLMSQIKKTKDKLIKAEKGKNKKSDVVFESLSSISDYKGEKHSEIVEEDMEASKPMNTEEAMAEIEISKEKILMFYNVDFNKICLIRKRRDNKYGLTISKY